MLATLIYIFCALTSVACAWLLLRSYRRTRLRLLLWSGLCFAGLTANNILLVLDRLVLVNTDLSTARLLTGFAAVALLLFGLIIESG